MTNSLKKPILFLLVTVLFLFVLQGASSKKLMASSYSSDFSEGRVSGQTYENAFFGYRLNAPDGYSFKSDEQVASENGVEESMMHDTEAIAKYIQKGDALMVASMEKEGVRKGGINNVVITIAGSGGVELSYTEKEYMEMAMNDVKNSLEKIGATVENTKVVPVNLGGERRYAMSVDAAIQGYKLYQKQLISLKGGYAICITASTFDEDRTEELIDALQVIK